MAANEVNVNMMPSHPGDFIRTESIEELGLTVTKAAEILGNRRATLSDLLNDHTALSAEMALRISKAFEMSMDTLLGMQAWYAISAAGARMQVKSPFDGMSLPDPRVLPNPIYPVGDRVATLSGCNTMAVTLSGVISHASYFC